MSTIDKFADEPTEEIDRGLYFEWYALRAEVLAKKRALEDLELRIQKQMGKAHAATIDGVKVLTNRPTAKIAEKQLRARYPELTEAFVRAKVVDEFDLKAFAAQHPVIVEEFRSRSFRAVDVK